jgi:hypothetical protein
MTGMDRHDLTPEQAAKIRDVICQQFTYLWRLTDRMKDRGFPLDDDLYTAATHARDSARKLMLTLGEIGQPARLETIGERAARLNREANSPFGMFANWAG